MTSCEACDGKGQVQVKTEDDDYDSDGCERCGGTGQRLVAGGESGQLCGECGGRGDIMVSDYIAPDTPGLSPAKCPGCLGTGVQA